MANNLRVFNLISDYNETELVKPSVSFVVENGKVYYDDVPSPFQGKWLATYSDSHTESAQCDGSSAITNGEINKTNLLSVEIGDCVTSIGQQAFNECSGLTSCTIGDNVVNINKWSFQGCTSLRSINIPNSVTTIGDFVFQNCNNLSNIEIGSGITSIGSYAFAYINSTSIVKFRINAVTPPSLLGGRKCFPINTYFEIYVPSQSVNAYKTASGWSSYASRIYPIS